MCYSRSNEYSVRFEHDKVALITISFIIYGEFFSPMVGNASVNARSIDAVTLNRYAYLIGTATAAATTMKKKTDFNTTVLIQNE